MPNWILFETTDSVIEVLWDVALAFFVIRLAMLYAGLTLLSAWSLLYLVHHLPPSLATYTLGSDAPISTWALTTFLSALGSSFFLARHYEIPRVFAFRLAVGVTGAMMALGAEAIVRGLEYEALGWKGEQLVAVMGGGGGWSRFLGAMATVAAMPVLVIALERCCEGRQGVVLRDRPQEKGAGPSVVVGEKKEEAGDL